MEDKNQGELQKRKESIIGFVCRQTDYTEEQAIEKLEKVDYDGKQVVSEYLSGETDGITEKTAKNNKSVNQQIYGEIRNLMDTGMRQFNERQEVIQKQEQIKAMNEYLNKINEERSKVANDSSKGETKLEIIDESVNESVEEDIKE